MDTTLGPPLDEAGLVQILEVHRARPLADLDGLMDLGRAYARSAGFPVLVAVDRWLADHGPAAGHDAAAGLDAAGCFLQGYWQEADDRHDGLVARFLDHAEANAPENLTRELPNRLVFVLAKGLRRTSSPEIVRRARTVLSRLAGAADRVHLGWGARRVLEQLQGNVPPRGQQ